MDKLPKHVAQFTAHNQKTINLYFHKSDDAHAAVEKFFNMIGGSGKEIRAARITDDLGHVAIVTNSFASALAFDLDVARHLTNKVVLLETEIDHTYHSPVGFGRG